jgi:hypothetical protein
MTSVTLAARRGKVLFNATAATPPAPPPPPKGTVTPETPTSGQVTIKPRRPRVRQGARIVLIGTAGTAESVDVSGRLRGEWRSISSDVEVIDGTFRLGLRASRPGRHWFRAAAAGVGDSEPIRVRVKARVR